MNKITIPALLVATIMVAGAFAFMPIEQASTVHLSGTTTLGAAGIGVGDFADNSITADALAALGATKISDAVDADGISVVTVDAGGIAVGTFAANAIDNNAIAADFVTKIDDDVEHLICVVGNASAQIAGDPETLIDAASGTGDLSLFIWVATDDGVAIPGLIAADFTITADLVEGADAATVDQNFLVTGGGFYTIDYDADGGDWGVDGAIEGYVFTVVVDDLNDDDTTLEGTCVSPVVTLVVTAA